MLNNPDELIPTRWTLIKRLKNWDDQESWREFFEIYWKLIFGVATKAGLNHDEAQEVVQTTVMSVCKNIKEFKADPSAGSFKAWLLKLTRWRITDQLRKRPPDFDARVHRPSQGDAGGDHATPTEENIPDPAGNFLEAIWDEEWAKNLVDAAMEKLKKEVNARQFQVFYLTVIKESSPQQVAKVTGVSVDQVYVIKHRVSRLFKKALEELENHTSTNVASEKPGPQ